MVPSSAKTRRRLGFERAFPGDILGERFDLCRQKVLQLFPGEGKEGVFVLAAVHGPLEGVLPQDHVGVLGKILVDVGGLGLSFLVLLGNSTGWVSMKDSPLKLEASFFRKTRMSVVTSVPAVFSKAVPGKAEASDEIGLRGEVFPVTRSRPSPGCNGR